MSAVPVGLDYGAALMLGEAMGADLDLLADILPSAEAALVSRFAGDGGDSGFFDNFDDSTGGDDHADEEIDNGG